jgi:hypothetical protein
VYPGESETQFNSESFTNAPNVLTTLFPDMASHSDLVRPIDVPASTGGLHVQVTANPHSWKAICFLQ